MAGDPAPVKGPTYISVRQLGAWVVAVVAGLVSIAAAHENFVMPGILERADERGKELLQDAVKPLTESLEQRLAFERERVETRSEVVDSALQRIERRLGELATSGDIDRLRERMDELSKRVEAAEQASRK